MSQFAVYYHTHWDREWYQPFRSYQIRLAEVGDEILERLERDELPCFMLDGQVIVLSDYLELRPENRTRLETLIRAGRLDIGPWLLMPDEFLVSGESLLRNLALGIAQAKGWGCHRFTGYLPDTFGHSADIPTLLKGFGIDSAILWRGVQPPGHLFPWRSPSGEEVTALHLSDGYFQMAPDDWTLSLSQKREALATLAKKLETAKIHDDVPLLIPSGGDHLGPTPAEGRTLLLDCFPNIWETTPALYMAKIVASAQTQAPIAGELADHQGAFLLPGVWSARLYLKQANRQMEHWLTRRLEPLLALVHCMSSLGLNSKQTTSPSRYPATELALAWETLLMNHPHDSICGCSVDAVHRENEVRFDHVRQIVQALEDRAIERLRQVWPQLRRVGFVLNTGDRPYSGVVPVEWDAIAEESMAVQAIPYQETPKEAVPGLHQHGHTHRVLQDSYKHDPHRIPMAHLTRQRHHGWRWVENVPAFGLQAFEKELTANEDANDGLPDSITPVKVTTHLLQNGLLSATVQPDGTLTVEDLASNAVYTGLLRFSSRQDQGDSYNSAPTSGDIPVQATFLGAEVETTGPLVSALCLRHELHNPMTESSLLLQLETRVELRANEAQLTFETRFTNRCLRAHKVQVHFETALSIAEVLAESHYSCVTRRYDPTYHPTQQMPVAPWKELKSNTGPVQRFWSANGQSWLSEGLTEYEVEGSQMAITLLRTFTALSAANTGVRGAQAGPPLPTPEGACLDRPVVARYAWLPTPKAIEDLYQAANRFYGVTWGYGPDPDLELRQQNGEPFPLKCSQQVREDVDLSAIDREFSLLHWDNSAIQATACHWLPGRGLILRLMNTSRIVAQTSLQTSFPYQLLHCVDFGNIILETLPPHQPKKAPPISLKPFAVQTYLFEIET
jgi:mannosylglycerate hydrolase